MAEEGIPPLQWSAMGVHSLLEDRDSETEFITISWWQDVAAMTAFVGDDPTRIHHLERDSEFLIELPERVQIVEIFSAFGHCGSDPRL